MSQQKKMKCNVLLFILICNAGCTLNETENRQPWQKYTRDPNRFIAHAGGEIDGLTYTNSLEALNASYDNGFMKFELDIRRTSDGHFVAVHDWPLWKKQTNFEGVIPPTKQQFLSQKIHGKYTPMAMEDINDWFKNRPNAILITDKVKQVHAFSNQFIDRKRLGMEMFKWQSVEQGLALELGHVIPTGNLIAQYPGDVVNHLKSLGIRELAMSRNYLSKKPELIRQLNKEGFMIYAFHLNASKGFDTMYMICNERQFFYGMYADQWSQSMDLNCDE